MALDISNHKKTLYITELNDCVRVVDLIKREVYTLCGGFESKNGLKDGSGNEALMNFPYGLVKIDQSTIVLTESDNHSLRMLKIKQEPLFQTEYPSPTKSERKSLYS